MLRVDGLKRPYTRKRDEVRRAKESASIANDVALHSTIINDLETKATEMTQAAKIQELEAALQAANQRAEAAEAA